MSNKLGRSSSIDSLNDDDDSVVNEPESPNARLGKLLAEIPCSNYTGKLQYRDRRILLFRGAMCNFYRCTLPAEGGNGRIVVVKRRQMSDYHGTDLPACHEELLLWNAINGHDNILPLLGYILDGPSGCPSLIAEWTPNGTVMEYLAAFPTTDLVPLCHGVARGLAFMHQKGIIHGNVKQKNVLVRADGTPLLSGFTLSIWPELQEYISGTSEDSDLESENPSITAGPTKQADVWAYGMTVMTVIQRFPASSTLTRNVQAVDAILSGKAIPESDAHGWYGGLWTVCQACWHPDVKNQPTMIAIVQAFNNGNLKSFNTLAVASNLMRTLLNFRQIDLSGKVVQLEDHNRSHGGSSDVYFGRSIVHDKLVAIKRVRYRLQDNVQVIKRMVRELQIWARLDHRNVLPLFGFTTDGGLYYLSLITEWMNNGTVIQYIKANRDSDRTTDILHMVEGIASGLAYLHGQNIVHSDMKSGNVLISSEGEPLLTDFGISHMLSSTSIASLTTGTYGTTRWMAYEQINIDDRQTCTPYTFQTDVWSFGMTILELLTLEVPYAQLSMDQQVMIAIYKKTLPLRPEGYDLEWPEESRLLWTICESCWNFDPASRPSVDMILGQLDEIRSERDEAGSSTSDNGISDALEIIRI